MYDICWERRRIGRIGWDKRGNVRWPGERRNLRRHIWRWRIGRFRWVGWIWRLWGSGSVVNAPGTGKGLAELNQGADTRSAAPVQGLVNGGQSRAISGARVYVLEASTGPRGSSSVSLLTAAATLSDAIGHYVQTNEHGGFTIAGAYRCTPGRDVYLYARGGNSGGDGVNPAIGLMTRLGSCPVAGNFDRAEPFVFVNAVTTVAAAYAMAGTAMDATHVWSGGDDARQRERNSASEWVGLATGFAKVTDPLRSDGASRRNTIHTLANVLSACINSNGPQSVGCTGLFTNARRNGATGAKPEDTATAAINIAQNPRANVAALYRLQPRAARPFEPALESEPADFDLAAPENAKPTVAMLSMHP